jgi:hypothetical protein
MATYPKLEDNESGLQAALPCNILIWDAENAVKDSTTKLWSLKFWRRKKAVVMRLQFLNLFPCFTTTLGLSRPLSGGFKLYLLLGWMVL